MSSRWDSIGMLQGFGSYLKCRSYGTHPLLMRQDDASTLVALWKAPIHSTTSTLHHKKKLCDDMKVITELLYCLISAY